MNGRGIVHDVPPGGLRVVEDQPVKQGDRFSIQTFLPLAPASIPIHSTTVQWVKGREFGLHIVAVSSLAEATIKAVVLTVAEQSHPEGYEWSVRNG